MLGAVLGVTINGTHESDRSTCDRGVHGSRNSNKLIGIFNTIFVMPFNKISKHLFTFTSMDVTSVVYTPKRFNTT